MIHLDPFISSNNYEHYYHPGILSYPCFSSSLVFVHSVFTEHHCVTRPWARHWGFEKSKPEPSLAGVKSPLSEVTGAVWATGT